ncbi:MAG TPA: hypothetical protein VGL86_13815 [Polyangia bacterium]
MQQCDGKEVVMTRVGRFVTATGVGLLSWAGVAVAQQPSHTQQPSNTQQQQQQPSNTQQQQQPSGMQQQQPSETVMGQVITASATVQSVDMKKRDVSLKDADGNQFVVNVPSDVVGLDTLKKGDRVGVTYKQSLALALKKSGAATAPSETEIAARNANQGGVMGRQITASVKVTKVDPQNNKITFRDAAGKTDTINVNDPDIQSQLNQIKPGDKIQATYTQAIAMSVTPKNKG